MALCAVDKFVDAPCLRISCHDTRVDKPAGELYWDLVKVMKVLGKRLPRDLNVDKKEMWHYCDMCSYAENFRTYAKMIQSFKIAFDTQIVFDEDHFRRNRYGFDPTEYKKKLSEDEAALYI